MKKPFKLVREAGKGDSQKDESLPCITGKAFL